MIKALLSILFFLCLATQASSQGYLGTVNTGAGIEPPITVGSGAAPQGASVGASVSAPNMTGTMSLNLIGGVTRQVTLDVIQRGDLILGYGNMTAGTGSQRVNAAGSLTSNGLMLYILPIDFPEVYRLEIAGAGAAMSGRYQAFAANGAAWSGTVTADATSETEVSVTASTSISQVSATVRSFLHSAPVSAARAAALVPPLEAIDSTLWPADRNLMHKASATFPAPIKDIL